jgi:hypothetical protein
MSAGIGMQRGGQGQGICVEMTLKEFVRMPLARMRWTGPHDAHGLASAPWLCGYARTPVGLHQGLDGVLSAVSAQPMGQAA